MEDLISINEEGIDRLVLDLFDHSERINNILNQINDLILDSKNYFKCQANDELQKTYSDMKLSINNFKANIATYSNDLIKVKSKFRNASSELTTEIKKETTNIQSMDDVRR